MGESSVSTSAGPRLPSIIPAKYDSSELQGFHTFRSIVEFFYDLICDNKYVHEDYTEFLDRFPKTGEVKTCLLI